MTFYYFLIYLLVFPLYTFSQTYQSEKVSEKSSKLTGKASQQNNSNIQTEKTQPIDQMLAQAEIYLTFLPDTSLTYTRKALTKASKLNYLPGIAKSNHLLGQIFANFGAYSSAADHYYQAVELYDQLDKPEGLANTYNSLGDLYYYTRQLNESLQEHKKALSIAQEHQFVELEAITLGYIGHFYEKQFNYDEALKYQQKALNIYEQLNDSGGLSTIYGHLGSIYEDLEQYEKAFTYFSLALKYNAQTSNEEERIIHLNNMGDIFRKRGLFSEALTYSKEAEQLAKKLNNAYQAKSAKRDLAKVYNNLEQYAKAYQYLDSAYELNEKLFDSGVSDQITRMQSLYEVNKTLRELDNLKQDQKINKIIRQSLLISLGLLMIVFLLILSRQKLKNRKDNELLKAKQALISRELENSQLREKQLEWDLQTRAKQLSGHALSIVQKNNILKDIKTQLIQLQSQHKVFKKPISTIIHRIDQSFHFDKDWKKFNRIFEQVHPEFYRRLNEKYPHLSSAEIRLCALLRLNLEPKDIASILGISLDSLRVSRYRLRKKLQLQRGTNLITFVMNI